MHVRRLVPLALGVVGLVALAGIASHGRPLSGSRGGGPTATFFDYVFTTIVIAAVVVTAVVVYALVVSRRGERPARRGRWHLVQLLFMLLATALIAALLVELPIRQHRLHSLAQRAGLARQPPLGQKSIANVHARSARLRWDEVAIVVALLAGVAAFALAARRTAGPAGSPRLGSRETLSLAIDESLDDLRNDPDLRRAIIAAYARAERALAAAGLPRRAAEAPFEYLERTLRALDTSRPAVARLTTLFEWAKFSQHEPEPQMRGEAIEALLAVREELRRPADAAVA
jgi:hypothetical protein